MIHSYADGAIEDTGPLTRKRMETADDEFIAAAKKFIDSSHKAGKPFFAWVNTTGMHFRTHTKASSLGRSGQGFYNDSMMDHDDKVGELLDQLDALGIADNTIVFYSTDNGVHFNTWPDAGITPFRSEKNTNWEGAYRVPAMVRWPGRIKAGQVSNEIMSHLDWMPTLVAAAGDPALTEKMLKGTRIGSKNAKLHLDGFNFLPYLTGAEERGPRKVFHYFNDEAMPVGVRVGDWKIIYAENRAKTMALWAEPFVVLRMFKIYNLRRDPFERAEDNSNQFWDWMIDKAPQAYQGVAVTTQFLQTLAEYPPSQRPDSWSIDKLTDRVHVQSEVARNAMSTALQQIDALRSAMERSVIGQSQVVEALIIALLTNGNVLLEGYPGTAKTRSIKTLASVLDAQLGRVQFTPDLLPSDVTGTEIYQEVEGRQQLRFQRGPIFNNLVLADEINRAPAKVQSALLEAMEERQVTVAGTTYPLPALFMVLATQNPIEQEGTYPLPEAQMDRFLMKINLDYPGEDTELDVVRLVRAEESPGTQGNTTRVAQQHIFDGRKEVRQVHVSDAIEKYLVALVMATRQPDRYPTAIWRTGY